jgi:hypothetical protein
VTSRHTEQRRARAAAAVAEQRRRERRRRSAIVAGGVALAVALLVAVGVAVQSHRTATSSSGATPAAATAQGGFTSGAATARASVVVYEDFQCPVCRQFEQDAGSALDALVQQGVVRAEWRPIAILDRASTSQYSTRAASAAACAADAGDFRRYAEALFREQPPEGGAGLSDRRLVDLGRDRVAIRLAHRAVLVLHGELADALQHRVDLGQSALGGLDHAHAVLGVALRLGEAADLPAHALGDAEAGRVVATAVDAVAGRQPLHRLLDALAGVDELAVRVERLDVVVDAKRHPVQILPSELLGGSGC